MTKLSALALIALVMLPTSGAFAYNSTNRQTHQLGLIERGRQSGDITWSEALKLRKEQREIQKVENDLGADGRLSKSDRRVLRKLQNQAENHIEYKATNNWHRAWWLPRVGR